jgi:hypothetical protein
MVQYCQIEVVLNLLLMKNLIVAVVVVVDQNDDDNLNEIVGFRLIYPKKNFKLLLLLLLNKIFTNNKFNSGVDDSISVSVSFDINE